MIDVYASERHYLDHLLPIRDALLEHGAAVGMYGSGSLCTTSPKAKAAGMLAGLPPPRYGRDPVLVASYGDELKVRKTTGRPIILLEHGAGQDYAAGEFGAHPGGPDRDDVVLFLCPGDSVARRNRGTYPNARIAVVGCPKLDRWHGDNLGKNGENVVAFAWHWDCQIVPEARTAFDHYAGELEAVSHRWDTLGHGHPRILSTIAPAYWNAGVRVVWELEEVLERASVLVFDTTSAGYEFASTGRPVVVVNSPRYRRKINHGLRFWDDIPGTMIDEPAELLDAIELALEDPPVLRSRRESAVAAVYAFRDGRAAERAAAAILEL